MTVIGYPYFCDGNNNNLSSLIFNSKIMGIFTSILNRRIGNKQQKEAAELISAMVSGQGEDIFPQQMGPTKNIIINLVFKQVNEGSGAKYKANLVEMGLGTQKTELEKSNLLFISSVRVNKGYEVEEDNPLVNLQIPVLSLGQVIKDRGASGSTRITWPIIQGTGELAWKITPYSGDEEGRFITGLELELMKMPTGRWFNLSFEGNGNEVDVKDFNITENDFIFFDVDGNPPSSPFIPMKLLIDGQPMNVNVPGIDGGQYKLMYVTYSGQKKIVLQHSPIA